MTITPNELDQTDYLRNADLSELADALKDHRTRALDVVATTDTMSMSGGSLVLSGIEPEISEDGVTDRNGLYRPTSVGDEGIARTLDIPVSYLRRMRRENLDLLDANVNSWLRHPSNAGKKHLYRMLVNPTGEPNGDAVDGVVRAVLSDSYKCIDNFDILLATLHGMRSAGIVDPVITADLTERRMVVRVVVPQVAVHAPELLKDYRNPFGDGERLLPGWTPERVARAAGIEGMGYKPGEEPVLFAGFVISNSETGGGAFRITPELCVRICKNGLMITAHATKEIHLGGKLDAGLITWSEATRQANVQLVMRQTQDVVTRFISKDYVTDRVTEMEKEAGLPVKPSDAPKVIADVSKSTRWTQAEQDSILNFFMDGGQFNAGGIMQAVSAVAQTLPGDAAWEMENMAVKTLSLVQAVGKP